MEIKLKNSTRQTEVLIEQNKKFSDTINSTVAKCDNYERDLATQKEILLQYDKSKKELISRLREELDTVEERF